MRDMRDIKRIHKTLLMSEFDIARSIWEQLVREGYGPIKSAAIIYRHGVLDGRSDMKAQRNNVYQQLSLANQLLIDNGIPLPESEPCTNKENSSSEEELTNE